MVDKYQTGEPIPDGWLSIQLINPISTYIDYIDLALVPANLDAEFNIHVPFKDMITHKEDVSGIVIVYEDHRDRIPWSNVHNATIHYNSEEYREALAEFQLEHDHSWEPQVDDYGANYQFCEGCKVSDRLLEGLRQQKIDKQRGLK